MVRRHADIAFGGMWVFPGGRVEPGDGDGVEGARAAAVREAAEETALVLDALSLVPLSHWTPPASTPRRFATWFFLAPAPSGAEVQVDMGEIREHVWTTPATAFDRHRQGDIGLVAPTWVTLDWLSACADVGAALDRAQAGPVERYVTKLVPGPDGARVAMWPSDAGYAGGVLEADGPRHRLVMGAEGWRYLRTDAGQSATT